MKNVKLFPLNLQFFASDDGADNNVDNGQNESQSNTNGSTGNTDGKEDEKTFTQDQVNSMMAREKNEGKRSVLKSLGFSNEEEAKKAITLFNAMMDSQKTAEEKLDEELSKKDQELSEYKNRAFEAENKLLCLENGVNKDSVDDVLAIAKCKVTDSKNLSKVLSEMKKDSKYSSFFTSAENNGTGNDPGHSGSSFVGKGEYGKGLAERVMGNAPKREKSNYF